jgi:hypothetical protein
MLFFGLFSTHLPYIVLGILYLVGMGLYSLNQIDSSQFIQKNQDKAEIKVEKPVHIDVLKQQNHKTYCYSKYFKVVKSVPHLLQEIFYFIPVKTIHIGYFVSYIYSNSIKYCYFQRPPPVC